MSHRVCAHITAEAPSDCHHKMSRTRLICFSKQVNVRPDILVDAQEGLGSYPRFSDFVAGRESHLPGLDLALRVRYDMLEPHVRKLLCKGVGQVVLNGSVGQLLDVACLLALSHETDGKFVAELKRVEWLVTRVEVFDL